MSVAGPQEASLEHLIGRLACLAARVRAIVAVRRSADPRPLDRMRGLVLAAADLPDLDFGVPPGSPPAEGAPEAADRAAVELAADEAERAGGTVRLRRLARLGELPDAAVEILLVALAPDVDRRFEPYYGFLHDDVTRRRATTGLALQLAGLSPLSAAARALLQPGSPLVDAGLLVVEEEDRPFLTRSLRVPDRVTGHLLGDDRMDPVVARAAQTDHPWVVGDPGPIARTLAERSRLCYLQEPRGAETAAGLAVEAFRRWGGEAVALDLRRIPADDLGPVVAAAFLEARLAGTGLVAGPIDVVAERSGAALRSLTEPRWPAILWGAGTWDAEWATDTPLVVAVPAAGPDQRAAVWRAVLDGECPPGLDPAAATTAFDLNPAQVARAAASAWVQAGFAGRDIEPADLLAGARGQNATTFERLARRIEPAADWNDLVVSDDAAATLRDIVGRIRHRDLVHAEWGLGSTGRGAGGVTALFAGPPGTGKTTAAEVIARSLGFDLFSINLATVVDKYIGETEKNLERIFAVAERVNGVLFFDEADALFGKRSEVKDARDRYANVEVAYLLQRLEVFSGVAILATNLRANLDEAFTRRLDALVDFGLPGPAERLLLWQRFLSTGAPLSDDVDLDFCAGAFELSGGDIRNIALAAAFAAARDGGRAIRMADLIRATSREYRKLGRLCVEAEFGPYYGLLDVEPAATGGVSA